MKRSIFISRNLDDKSPLLQYLKQNDWSVHHRSLIQIEPIPFQIQEEYDWIFLASANGAKLLFRSFVIPEKTRIGVVGSGTAQAAKALGVFPDFIGKTSNMDDLGDQLARVIGKGTVLFAGAEGGSEKIRSKIATEQRKFVALYRTKPVEDAKVADTDVVFLTSPSNADSYLQHNSLEGKTVIAIGHTTAEYLQKRGIQNVLITKQSLMEDAIGILKNLRF